MKKPSISSTLKIEEFIKSLNEDELIYLNQLIVERIKLYHKARNIQEMQEFNLGEKVWFICEERKIMGKIIKLNRRTISIRTDDGGHWKISPGLLHRIDE